MSQPQRIVVGVDVDGSTDDAVSAAIALAREFHAGIELVHAAQRGTGDDAATLERARRAVRLRLEASLPGAQLPYVGEEHHLVVRIGQPAQVLLDRAGEPGTGLLVLGAHRRRGLVDLRSTAHYVLARAACPVWVQAGNVAPVRRILVPVDLSSESLGALATACAWAAVFGARILALHCFEIPEFAYGEGDVGPTYVVDRVRIDAQAEFERTLAAFAWGGVEHECRFVEAHPVTHILSIQDEADLIMLGTHGRTGLSRLLLGSVASALVREAHVPVVTLRGSGRAWLLPD